MHEKTVVYFSKQFMTAKTQFSQNASSTVGPVFIPSPTLWQVLCFPQVKKKKKSFKDDHYFGYDVKVVYVKKSILF